MTGSVLSMRLGALSRLHPLVASFLASVGVHATEENDLLRDWLASLDDARTEALGMNVDELAAHLQALVEKSQSDASGIELRSLTVTEGRDKAGRPHGSSVTLHPGEILCVVGPTGSGKSRFLADIECLAQGDTPSGRQVLLNGSSVDEALRSSSAGRLVAQISQNMNFVMDLTVGEFVGMHADCRGYSAKADVSASVLDCANHLAGEPFGPETALTELSGGQSRALMIADTAMLSMSPIVLIDEIENAGIDRRKALELLVAKDKLVILSTHDPLLGLLGTRRIAIRQGTIATVLETSPRERQVLERLEGWDRCLAALRHKLRSGAPLDDLLGDLPAWGQGSPPPFSNT